MRFGPVPVADALGTILAHGVPAAGLSKGIVLGSGHLVALSALGFKDVTVARLEADDVGEDAAAGRLADALVPGVMLATIKVISYGVPERELAEACRVVSHGGDTPFAMSINGATIKAIGSFGDEPC